MTKRTSILRVFQILRHQVPDELISDYELLQAAARLVVMHTPRKGRNGNRATGGATSLERRYATDFVLKRWGFRILCGEYAVFREAYEVADRHHDTAYAAYRRIAES